MESRYWVILSYGSSNDIKSTIAHWITTAPATVYGDFFVADFFSHVACRRVVSPTGSVTIPLHTQDPYQHCFTLFYVDRKEFSEVCILGGILYERLYELGGKVNLERDLVRSRCFVPPGEICIAMELEDPGLSEAWFWIPCDFPERRNKVGGDPWVDWECVKARIEWYFSCERNRDTKIPPPSMTREEEAAAIRLARDVDGLLEKRHSIPGTPLDMSVNRARFTQLRIQCEVERLRVLLAHCTQTEERTVHLFIKNGFMDHMTSVFMMEPTPMDNQCHFRRFPGTLPPTAVYVVPHVELPPEVSIQLPKYAGLTAHISFRDVAGWIITRFIAENRRAAFLDIIGGGNKEPGVLIAEEARQVAATLSQTYFRHKNGGRYNTVPVKTAEAPPTTGIDVTPDQLLESVPACMANIMRAAAFPKHMTRFHLVNALKHGGVAKETALLYFENKNNRYPKDGIPSALVDRFNFEATWNASKFGPSCAKIMQGSVGELRCPFVAGKLVDIEDMVGRQTQMKEIKGKCTKRAHFSGPHHVLEYNIANRPKSLVSKEEQSSSDSSAED